MSSCLFHLFSCLVWWALTDTWFFHFFFSNVPVFFFCFLFSKVIIIHNHLSNQDYNRSRQNPILTAVDGFSYYYYILYIHNHLKFWRHVQTFKNPHSPVQVFCNQHKSAKLPHSLCNVLVPLLYTPVFYTISTNWRITPDVEGHIILSHMISWSTGRSWYWKQTCSTTLYCFSCLFCVICHTWFFAIAPGLVSP